MPWLHLPEPLGAGRCTLACTARRPGPTVVWGECSRRVYAMAAHRLAQTAPPRSGAERAVVARGVHPGMHAAEGARARARPGSAGTGASTDRHARHRPIPPFCVTTATASLWVRHRRAASARPAQFRPRFLRPLVLQRKVRYVYIHPPTFPRYSSHRSSTRPPHLSDRAPSRLSGRDGLPTPRYVDVRQRIGTARPTLLGSRSGPRTPLQARSGSQGSFRFLRVLPGSPPLYLQVCECRHSN